MLTTIMKSVSIAGLLIAAFSVRAAAEYQFLLNCVVCLGATLVGYQAAQLKKRLWVVGFAAIALLFTPLAPTFRLVGAFSELLALLSIAPFVYSLIALKT